MPILSLAGIEKYYGGDRVLSGVDLAVEKGQKLALVGRNGCGKTTLLHIAAGLLEADRGEAAVARGAQIALLTQSFTCADPARSLWAEMEAVFADLLALEEELAKASEAMAGGGEEPLRRYSLLQEEFERRGGYEVRPRIEKVLRGMGFCPPDWTKPVKVLSGGELTRAALARLLLRQPDLILLDEPTNHLDLWTVAWLEEYLSAYAGAVLVVSHDRYFLDRVVEGVYELADGRVRYYRGNYTAYRAKREAERQAAEHAREVRERELARKERLVREAAADERSKRQARSIAKSIARLDPLDVPPADGPAMRLNLSAGGRGGRTALRVEGLAKRYGARSILRQVSFDVESGEKVGIVGPNGAGKTTLLRLIVGRERADGGTVRLGHNIQPAYFAQDDAWEGGGTVFAAVQEAGGGDNLAVRSHLARFLFRGEDVWKNVAELSGGERRRLALAVLTLSRANLLLLDEPTNHLDLPSVEALEEAIRGYSGTVMVVSHDRYFLARVADRLLAIADGELRPFRNYEAFAAWHAAEETRAAEERARAAEARREKQRREQEARREPLREEKRRARRAAELEAALAAREEARAALLAEMSRQDICSDFVALRERSTALAALEAEIERLYEEWGAVADGS